MYRHILVPTDGSPRSARAARTAAELASGTGATITALYVKRPLVHPSDLDGAAYGTQQYIEAVRRAADAGLAAVIRAARARGVEAKGIALTAEAPWRGIVETARRRKCDLIVMASHGRKGLEAVLLGSETQKVLTHSRTPVLVCR